MLTRLTRIIGELKELGFDEVVFTEFRMPDTDGIYFNGDREGAIRNAAEKIVTACGSDSFTVSFMTDKTNFPLPEGGRSRIYLQNISAKTVDAVTATVQVPNTLANLVFMATTNDTRFDAYSSLKPITLMNNPQQ